MNHEAEESAASCLHCGDEVSLENQTDAVGCEELVCLECAARRLRRWHDTDAR